MHGGEGMGKEGMGLGSYTTTTKGYMTLAMVEVEYSRAMEDQWLL